MTKRQHNGGRMATKQEQAQAAQDLNKMFLANPKMMAVLKRLKDK